jgi:hypothetical protein
VPPSGGISSGVTSTLPEQVVDYAGASPNRLVNGLAAEISFSSRSVEEVFAARAAAAAGNQRQQENSVPEMESRENG